MAYYRTLHLSFWTDAKVDDDFTPEDKYFYLYLLTNPSTNLVGCYEISAKQMVKETGYNEDTVFRLLKRMEEVHGVARYDKRTKEVLILNWHKYNWTKSPKFIAAAEKEAKSIKSDTFREYMHTVLLPYIYGSDTSVTVSVSVTDINNLNNLDNLNSIDNLGLSNKDNSLVTEKEKNRTVFEEDSEPYNAAQYLAKSIAKNFPQLKEPTEADKQRWAADFDKCNRIDGYDWDRIADVLKFSQQSQFWRKNIRSGSKFREKFDRLLIEMEDAKKHGKH